MDSIERVELTLNHKEPDKVPKGELGISKEIVAKMRNKKVQNVTFKDEIEVRKSLHWDVVSSSCRNIDIFINALFGGPKPIKIDETENGNPIYRDGWGTIAAWDGNSAKILKNPITSLDKIEKYEFPDIDSFDVSRIEGFSHEHCFYTMSFVGGVHDQLIGLLGFDNFMVYSLEETAKIKKLAQRCADINAKIAEKQVSVGSRCVIIGDDLGYKAGTFLPPDILRQIVFPFLKNEISKIKKFGVPVFLHSDGNFRKVLDDVVEAGFDGIQSIEPAAGMDISEIKQYYGDKLVLMGNIDISEILPRSSPDEVKETVKQTIKTAGPGGGYILSTSNSITKDIPLENIKAMYETADKYGVYPLN